MTDLRLHDLRRTLGRWLTRTGATVQIAQKALNHETVRAAMIYSRLDDMDPLRQSVQTATSAMLEAGGIKKAAEVVTLRSARG